MKELFNGHWKNYPLYRIYVALSLLALVWQLFHLHNYVDSTEYINAAKNLFHGHFPDSCLPNSTCDHWLHETRRTPGYPLMLLAFGVFPLTLLWFQFLVGILIPLYTLRLFPNNRATKRNTNVLFLFFLLYPLQFFYTASVLPEIWCQFFLLQFLIYWNKKNAMAVSLYFTALILLKPFFILGFPLLILLWFRPFKLKLSVFIPLGIMILISYWNYHKTKVFHYNSISIENFYEYNHRALLNVLMTDEELQRYENSNDSILKSGDFAERYNFLKKERFASLGKHWKLYAWLHLRGCVLSLADPGRFDVVTFFGLENRGGVMGVKESGGIRKISGQPWYLILYIMIFAVLNAAKMMLAFYAGIRNFRKFVFWMSIIAVFVLVTGPVGSARYLFPVMPLIILMATQGWQNIFSPNEKNSVDQ